MRNLLSLGIVRRGCAHLPAAVCRVSGEEVGHIRRVDERVVDRDDSRLIGGGGQVAGGVELEGEVLDGVYGRGGGGLGLEKRGGGVG